MGKNFDDCIPRFECPDPAIEEIFRYRWKAYSTHLFKRANGNYIVTEFSTPVTHGGVDGTISCPASHHIYEGRWIGNRVFMRDYISFWLTDEAAPRLYSFPLADSCFKYYLVSGEKELIEKLYDGMAANYEAWERERFDEETGLFWQIPDRDGMEFSLLSLSCGNGHGGEGYRSTLNSYMYGDAAALARMAKLLDRRSEEELFRKKAENLKIRFQHLMWNRKRGFFVDRRRDNKFFVNGIELSGYIPWCYGMPDPQYSCAWKYIADDQYFCGPFGLRTLEKNHEDYLVEHSRPGLCMWNGWCWPFASCQALGAMANLLNDYDQSFVSKEDYFKLLKTYTMCHYKDGVPHLAESYDPDGGFWYTDRGARSVNYNHSTFCDLVISGLAGIRPGDDGKLRVTPLIPENWRFFALYNLPFRGCNLAVFFDRDGRRYGFGTGLFLLVDGKVAASASGPGAKLEWQTPA